MKKLLFFTYWKFDDAETNGITKKIISQKKVFENNGYRVDLVYLLNGNYYIDIDGKKTLIQKKPPFWTKLQAESKLRRIIKNEKYDAAYFRYNCCDVAFVSLLKELKKNGTKNIIEIPTVEYDNELSTSFLGRVLVFVDKLHRNNLKKYTDKIVVFQDYQEVYGIPTIRTYNGLDIDEIKLKNITDSKDVRLICVAQYQMWHSLERILYGLVDYYSHKVDKIVILNVVGDGPALSEYKEIVKNGKIDKYINFVGRKSGKELDDLFDESDIAIETLGGHKINMKTSSTMKSREYLARGIPYISELYTDVVPEGWDYLLKIPYDDSKVDISTIVDYYNKSLSTVIDKEQVANNIRQFAVSKIDMNNTMKPVVEEFDE